LSPNSVEDRTSITGVMQIKNIVSDQMVIAEVVPIAIASYLSARRRLDAIRRHLEAVTSEQVNVYEVDGNTAAENDVIIKYRISGLTSQSSAVTLSAALEEVGSSRASEFISILQTTATDVGTNIVSSTGSMEIVSSKSTSVRNGDVGDDDDDDDDGTDIVDKSMTSGGSSSDSGPWIAVAIVAVIIVAGGIVAAIWCRSRSGIEEFDEGDNDLDFGVEIQELESERLGRKNPMYSQGGIGEDEALTGGHTTAAARTMAVGVSMNEVLPVQASDMLTHESKHGPHDPDLSDISVSLGDDDAFDDKFSI